MSHSLMTVFALAMAAVLLAGAVPAAAQAPVTAADIQRLQDNAGDIAGTIANLRNRDPPLADSLQPRLEELRDEVTYLKVKLRKETGVSPAEYIDLLDRPDRLRSDATGRPAAPPPETPASATEIPVGAAAIVAGMLGGCKGGVAGLLIGGGGTFAATDGTRVDLPAGTVLGVRMDSSLALGQCEMVAGPRPACRLCWRRSQSSVISGQC